MRIRVTRVDRDQSDVPVVFFSCDAGMASGRWMSEQEPTPGEYHAELELEDPVDDFEIVAVDSPASLAQNDDTGLLSVTAPVVTIGEGPEDPVLGVSLSGDVILLEVPSAFERGVAPGMRISFRVASAEIYPFSL